MIFINLHRNKNKGFPLLIHKHGRIEEVFHYITPADIIFHRLFTDQKDTKPPLYRPAEVALWVYDRDTYTGPQV